MSRRRFGRARRFGAVLGVAAVALALLTPAAAAGTVSGVGWQGTFQAVGSGSGTSACAPGTAVTGVTGDIHDAGEGPFVGGLTVSCAAVDGTGANNGAFVGLPPPNQGSQTRTCPQGTYVVGISGNGDLAPEYVILHCQDAVTLPGIGSSAFGDPQGPSYCPVGEQVVGMTYTEGVVDGVPHRPQGLYAGYRIDLECAVVDPDDTVTVTVTASSQTIEEGGVVAPVTASYSGFRPGDNASVLTTAPTCSTTATSSSPAGSYPSTCSGAAAPGYDFVYVNGTVTVTEPSTAVPGIGWQGTFIAVGGATGTTSCDPGTAAVAVEAQLRDDGEGPYVANVKVLCAAPDGSTTNAGDRVGIPSPGAATITRSCPAGFVVGLSGIAKFSPEAVTFHCQGDVTLPPVGTPTFGDFQGPFRCSAGTQVVGLTYIDGIVNDPDTGFLHGGQRIDLVCAAVDVLDTVTVTASSSSMTYGDAPPAVMPTYSGFRPGDDASVLTAAPTCSTAATSTSAVGSYASSCSGAAAPGYVFAYVDGVVGVTPRSLEVTASSATMPYGATPPAITASFDGFVNGDTAADLDVAPTCSTAATAASDVGSYPSSCAGGSDLNYDLGPYVDGVVEVTPLPLVVTASSATTTYGEDPPAITPSYDGFVNGDTAADLDVAPTCSTAATAASDVGSYPSSCAGGSDLNYDLGPYVDGVVEVTPRPLEVTASSATMPYGTAPPAITPTYDGFVNGDTAADLDVAPTCSTTATATSDVGSYPSSCAGGSDLNYDLGPYVDGVVEVTPARVGLVTSSTSGLVSLLTWRVTYTTVATNLDSGDPAVGVPVTITLRSAKPKPACTAVTNSQGVATCTAGPIAITLGIFSYPYVASSPAAGNYQAASAEGGVPLL